VKNNIKTKDKNMYQKNFYYVFSILYVEEIVIGFCSHIHQIFKYPKSPLAPIFVFKLSSLVFSSRMLNVNCYARFGN